MNVLITDGEQRAALALVRSFGRAGYKPCVVASRSRSLAGASRWSVNSSCIDDPLLEPEAFAATLRTLVQKWRIDVIVPTSEAALLCTLPLAQELAPAVIPFPDERVFRRICDKAQVLQEAAGAEIAVPRQSVLESPSELGTLSDADLSYPVVLKPARSVGEQDGTRRKVGVLYAQDADELKRRVAELPGAAFPLLLQHRVTGPGVGVFVLLREGDVLAAFAHRRIREKPPSGGVSVYRESVSLDPDLLERSVRLLRRLEWSGVAMVEYKLDAETGTPYLMEINGRFWGSLQLAIDAGVDFPVLLIRSATGEPVVPVTEYRVGVRSRWWWGEVDHLLAAVRRPVTDYDGRPRGKVQAMRDFMATSPSDINEVFRWNDPVPILRESLDWFARR